MGPEEIQRLRINSVDAFNDNSSVSRASESKTSESINGFGYDDRPMVDDVEITNKRSEGATPKTVFIDDLRKQLSLGTFFKDETKAPKEELVKYLKEKSKGTEFEQAVNGYIEQLNQPNVNFKKMYDQAKNDSVQTEIVSAFEVISIVEARRKTADVFNKIMNDKGNDFTAAINYIEANPEITGARNYKGDLITDEDGNSAVDATYKEYLATSMEAELGACIMELKSSGKFDNLKDNKEIRDAVLEVHNQHVKNSGKASEDFVSDSAFESYVKGRGDLTSHATLFEEREKAVMTRRKELKSVTWNEIEKGLGKSLAKKLKTKLDKYATKDKDGNATYDLSKLSTLIEDRVGDDWLINRAEDDMNPKSTHDAEFYFITSAYRAEIGESALKPKEARKIAEFCGYKVQPKDRTPNIIKMLSAGAEGAVTSSLAHMAGMAFVNVTQTVMIYEGDIVLDMIQQVVQSPVWLGLPGAAVAGALLPTVRKLIIGDVVFEKECFSKDDYDNTKVAYTNKNEYEKYLKLEHPQSYSVIKPLLDMYEADSAGNWNHAKFFNDLRQAAGLGSRLNCAEIEALIIKLGGKKVEPPIVQNELDILTSYREQEVEDFSQPIIESETVPEDKQDENIFFSKGARRSSWKKLVEDVYNCGDDGSLAQKYGLSRSIRMLKIAQAITDGNYEEDRLVELEKKSRKKGGLRNEPGIDYGTYQSMLLGNTMPGKLKLPTFLAGVERCFISEDEHELWAPKAADPGEGHVVKKPKNPAVGTATYNNVVGYQMEKQSQYGIGSPGQGNTWHSDMESFDKDLEGRLQEHPEANVRDGVEPEEFEKITKKKESEEE